MSTPSDSSEKIVAQPFVITREFAAPRALVWQAWTEPERLKQWLAPKGSTGAVFKMDLRAGGIFHSFLRSPNGQELWGKWVFREVTAPERLVWIHSFSDKDGGVTRHPWNPTFPLELLSETTFAAQGDTTIVTLQWTPFNATDEEIKTFNAAHSGMTHGWDGIFHQLAECLNQPPTTETK